MQKQKKTKKIVPYRKTSYINIGTVLFGALLIYMLICVIIYLTSPHITAYEVVKGSLSSNYHFTALALKTEQIVTAEESGRITYYAREANETASGSTVCSISQRTGSSSSASVKDISSLDADSLSALREKMASFSRSFQTINFQNVYNFKSDLESTVMELTSEEALASYDADSNLSGLVNLCTAPEAGILVFSTDGYENKTPETITAADFDQKSYTKENLRLNTTVKQGDPIYKLLTSENWNLLIQLDQKTATQLADSTRVKFRFTKDGNTASADFSIMELNGNYYGNLSLTSSLIRFSSDRFVEIELLLNQKTGLKIPTSAIARKSFFAIPKSYCSYDEDSPTEVRLIRETYDADGNATQKTITATLYDTTEDAYYVDMSLFNEGDCVIKPDSTKRYTVSETATLEGVYCINTGYARFREIKIIDENEEYCIVEDDSSYGLSAYDHIVLDVSTVKEDDIVV